VSGEAKVSGSYLLENVERTVAVNIYKNRYCK
jgi:hypothetical protein